MRKQILQSDVCQFCHSGRICKWLLILRESMLRMVHGWKKNEQGSGVYSVRIDLPEVLLFFFPPHTHAGIAFGLVLNTDFLVFLLQNAPQMQTLSSLFMLWQVSSVGTATGNIQSSFPSTPAGEQVSSVEKVGHAACFGLGKCTRWEEGRGKTMPLLLWWRLWGRTCFQIHICSSCALLRDGIITRACWSPAFLSTGASLLPGV